MTRKEALGKMETKWWVGKMARQICEFQLFEDRLCMPFPLYHKAVEKALKRPVWIHEFGSVGVAKLRGEFNGERKADHPLQTLAEAMGGKEQPCS